MDEFKDHFSGDAEGYARFRPTYPDGLFDWLASLAKGHELAVDAACGTGQASLGLTSHFDLVVGLDASSAQISRCPATEGVRFRVARAESTGLPEDSTDLLTVAQALHWLDLGAFYPEARRILRPGGLLAAWTYERFQTGAAPVDRIIDEFYEDQLGPFWPPERRHVAAGYQDLPFPFEEITAPAMEMTAEWNLEQVMGYLGTFSAVGRLVAAGHPDPLPRLNRRLLAHWESTHRVVWPIRIRAGRMPCPNSGG